MDQPFNTQDVHAALSRYLRARPDIGVLKAAADMVLQPSNPFAPKTARRPRRRFAFLVLIATLLLTSLLYFGAGQ